MHLPAGRCPQRSDEEVIESRTHVCAAAFPSPRSSWLAAFAGLAFFLAWVAPFFNRFQHDNVASSGAHDANDNRPALVHLLFPILVALYDLDNFGVAGGIETQVLAVPRE